MLGFHFFLKERTKERKKERKGHNYITLSKSFPILPLINFKTCCSCFLCSSRFAVVGLRCWRSFVICRSGDWGGGGGGQVLCIKLLGGSLLIGRAGGLPLPQVVAALILLPHAVDQEEDEEDGKQEANNTTCNNSWERQKKWRVNVELLCMWNLKYGISKRISHKINCLLSRAINYTTFTPAAVAGRGRFPFECDPTANDQNWWLKCVESRLQPSHMIAGGVITSCQWEKLQLVSGDAESVSSLTLNFTFSSVRLGLKCSVLD